VFDHSLNSSRVLGMKHGIYYEFNHISWVKQSSMLVNLLYLVPKIGL
jgi:hypothetical protein